MIVSYPQQLQDALIREGLSVTRLVVTGPEPFPGETVADQILEQLGQMPFWVRYRSAAHSLWGWVHVTGIQYGSTAFNTCAKVAIELLNSQPGRIAEVLE